MERVCFLAGIRPERLGEHRERHKLVSRQAAAVMTAQGMGGDIVYIVSKNAIFAGREVLPEHVAAAAKTLLLIPDLLAYWLTGSAGAEVTNASTTALLDVSTRSWAVDLMKKAGMSPGLFPRLRQPFRVTAAHGPKLPGS